MTYTKDQDKKYEFDKGHNTHVFVRPYFPWRVGEFINVRGLTHEALYDMIESKAIAEVKYL